MGEKRALTEIAEMLNHLTVEEKREFAGLVDLDELLRLKETGPDKRRVGDPRVYVGTTRDGLSFELPVEHVIEFIRLLVDILMPQKIEVYFHQNGEHRELSFTKDELDVFLETYRKILADDWMMIEFDGNTLISGGGGCLSLELEEVSKDTGREIAEKFLLICGFDHRFTSDEFSAIVWEGEELEVRE